MHTPAYVTEISSNTHDTSSAFHEQAKRDNDQPAAPRAARAHTLSEQKRLVFHIAALSSYSVGPPASLRYASINTCALCLRCTASPLTNRWHSPVQKKRPRTNPTHHCRQRWSWPHKTVVVWTRALPGGAGRREGARPGGRADLVSRSALSPAYIHTYCNGYSRCPTLRKHRVNARRFFPPVRPAR